MRSLGSRALQLHAAAAAAVRHPQPAERVQELGLAGALARQAARLLARQTVGRPRPVRAADDRDRRRPARPPRAQRRRLRQLHARDGRPALASCCKMCSLTHCKCSLFSVLDFCSIL